MIILLVCHVGWDVLDYLPIDPFTYMEQNDEHKKSFGKHLSKIMFTFRYCKIKTFHFKYIKKIIQPAAVFKGLDTLRKAKRME